MHRVLILGANGMLGQALQRTKPDTIELIAWDRGDCDITHLQEVMELIPGTNASWIVNCAAYNDVDGAQTHHDQAIAVNAQAVKHIADAATRTHARLLHISTDYVFDGTKQEGYAEGDPPNPLSVYGQSKLAGETEALRASGGIVVRTSRLFGLPGEGKKSFVDIILDKLKIQDRIEVIDSEWSSPTFVDDLAKELWKMVAGPLSAAGLYHRTNDGVCTWYEFAQEIIAIKKISCELVPVDASYYQRAAQRPKYSTLLTTKLPLMRSWQEALKEYLQSQS